MPTFTFKSPDGKSYDVAGPQGATKEQAFQILQQRLKGPQAAVPEPTAATPEGRKAITQKYLDRLHSNPLDVFSRATTGELAKAAGGVLQLLPGAQPMGEDLVRTGRGMERQAQEQGPISSMAGRIWGGAVPYTLAAGGGPVAQALKAGAIGFATTPEAPGVGKVNIPERAVSGALAGATAGALPWVTSKIGTLAHASGKRAATAAAGVKSEVGKLWGDIEQQTARRAESVAAGEKNPLAALRGAPGAVTKDVAGAITPVPASSSEVGQDARNLATQFVENIKSVRNLHADKNLAKSAEEAAAKGDDLTKTPAFEELKKALSKDIDVTTDRAMRSQLIALRDALEQDGQPLKFQSAEIIRRKLGDAGFGAPSEGYDAIIQTRAKDYYKLLSNSMKEYSPSFDKYLSDYARLSSKLEVTKTKLGRALTESAIPGKETNFMKVDPADIPRQLFKSGASFDAAVDALGGNKQKVASLARKYLVSQVAGKSPQEMRTFMVKNGDLIDKASARTALNRIVKLAEEDAKKVATRSKLVSGFTPEMRATTAAMEHMKPAEVIGTSRSAIQSAYNKGLIQKPKYDAMMTQINTAADELQKTKDVRAFIGKLAGVGGLAYVAHYYALKYIRD